MRDSLSSCIVMAAATMGLSKAGVGNLGAPGVLKHQIQAHLPLGVMPVSILRLAGLVVPQQLECRGFLPLL